MAYLKSDDLPEKYKKSRYYKELTKDNEFIAFTGLNETHSFKNYSYVYSNVDDKYKIIHLPIKYLNFKGEQCDNIEETINKIKQDGTIKLNNEDNPIEISSDGKLLQASTIADKILYKFSDGELHLVPYAFVEFIERKNNREGFETKNASRIFTSTQQ